MTYISPTLTDFIMFFLKFLKFFEAWKKVALSIPSLILFTFPRCFQYATYLCI